MSATTPETYLGSNAAAILDALTPALTTAFGSPIEVKLGTAEDARTGAPPRCVAVPPERAGRSYSGTAQQRPDLRIKAVHDVSFRLDFHLWGSSYTQAEQLEVALEQALYNAFSPNAYDLLPDGDQVGDNSPTGAGQTFLFVMPVRFLRVPLPLTTYAPVTLATTTAPGALTDPKGNNPTPGPDAGVGG
ncbi:MAG TPA: hypothetical protein VLT47_10875 [Anaeromyxobacteraceae bacterium]|nr:hypothetical protein [Anaeromyxobacteraceae bacterium]